MMTKLEKAVPILALLGLLSLQLGLTALLVATYLDSHILLVFSFVLFCVGTISEIATAVCSIVDIIKQH